MGAAAVGVTEEKRALFAEIPVPAALAKMALPAIVGQLVVLIYNMADTFFIGRTNNPYMVGGAALILPVFNICVSLSNLFGIGGGTLVSRLLGAGKPEEASKVSAFSFYTAVLFAGTFSVIMFLFMNPILRALGASEHTILFARYYSTCVIVFGAVPTVLSMTLGHFFRSCGYSKQAGFGISMGGLINMVLDPLFMFVLMPRGMEIVGAGIATMVSNMISTGYFLILMRRLRAELPISISPGAGMPGAEEIRSVFSVGVPSAIATFLFDLDFMTIDRLMAGYGDIPLAAIGIVLKAERLPLNTGIGLCQGMMPIAAYNYSAGNYKRMQETVRDTLIAGLAVAAVSISLYELAAPQIMRVFIAERATIRIGTGFLRARCLATVFMFLSFQITYLFQALGKGGYALWLGILRWLGFNIPMLFIMDRLFGMYGIVWAQMLADILTVTVSRIAYHRFSGKLGSG